MRVVAAVVVVVGLVAGQADALVLCRHKKSGAVVARDACKKKHVPLSPPEIGLGAATGGGLTLGTDGFALADGSVTTARVGARPAARVFHDAHQSIPNIGGGTTPHALAFNSERFDNADLHDPTTLFSFVSEAGSEFSPEFSMLWVAPSP